jgi:hypothetical protein
MVWWGMLNGSTFLNVLAFRSKKLLSDHYQWTNIYGIFCSNPKGCGQNVIAIKWNDPVVLVMAVVMVVVVVMVL